jgi:hypothetical protein
MRPGGVSLDRTMKRRDEEDHPHQSRRRCSEVILEIRDGFEGHYLAPPEAELESAA